MTTREYDYEAKPIDPDFLQKPDEYPQTGEHNGHKVFAEGATRMDLSGKPYPTTKGIHGSHVAVDFESCIADGVCMDVCPVDVFEWQLNPGHKGTGTDKIVGRTGAEWDEWRTDKSEPIRESDCIDCMACESACPTKAIKITPGA